MKIKCLSNQLNNEQVLKLGKTPKWFSTITPNNEYTVLGVYFSNESVFMKGITFEICSDVQMIETVPACLFEIIDSRVSQFWHAKQSDNSFLLWPKEFYQEFFHDDLTDGVPEVVETFKKVVYLMEREFAD